MDRVPHGRRLLIVLTGETRRVCGGGSRGPLLKVVVTQAPARAGNRNHGVCHGVGCWGWLGRSRGCHATLGGAVTSTTTVCQILADSPASPQEISRCGLSFYLFCLFVCLKNKGRGSILLNRLVTCHFAVLQSRLPADTEVGMGTSSAWHLLLSPRKAKPEVVVSLSHRCTGCCGYLR